MTLRPRHVFVANAVIAVGYAAAFFVAAGPVLRAYGIDPNPEAVYMTRWFGVGLLAIGLATWFTRDDADLPAGVGVARAFSMSYGAGIALALWGTIAGPFNWTGWIAVGFNTLLAAAFMYAARTSLATRDVSRTAPHRGPSVNSPG